MNYFKQKNTTVICNIKQFVKYCDIETYKKIAYSYFKAGNAFASPMISMGGGVHLSVVLFVCGPPNVFKKITFKNPKLTL